jgi:hypothetical protein
VITFEIEPIWNSVACVGHGRPAGGGRAVAAHLRPGRRHHHRDPADTARRIGERVGAERRGHDLVDRGRDGVVAGRRRRRLGAGGDGDQGDGDQGGGGDADVARHGESTLGGRRG